MSQCRNLKNSLIPKAIKDAIPDSQVLKDVLPDIVYNSLWEHQLACVYKGYMFEKHNTTKAELKGIFALSPGQGKTRIALALSCIEIKNETTNTLIIVPGLLYDHWVNEAHKIGLKETSYISSTSQYYTSFSISDSCNSQILIAKHREVGIAQDLYDYHRIIYDETETVITHRGKKKLVLRCDPEIRWLLNGTMNNNEYFDKYNFDRYDTNNMDPDMKLNGIRETAYVPSNHASAQKGWGNHYFPINTVLCSDEFVKKSQSLNLLPPIIEIHKVRASVSDSLNILSDKVKGFIDTEDYIGLRLYMETDSGIENVNLIEYANHVIKKNEESIRKLTKQMSNLTSDICDDMTNLAINDQEDICNDITKQTIKKFKDSISRLESENSVIKNKCCESTKLENCPICWRDVNEEVTEEPRALLKCCHTQFCYSCVYTWLSHNKRCPYCRQAKDIQDIIGISGLSKSPKNVFSRDDLIKDLCCTPGEKILIYGSFDLWGFSSPLDNVYSTRYFGGIDVATLQIPARAEKILNLFKDKSSNVNVLYLNDKFNAKGHDFSFVDKIIICNSDIDQEKLTQIIGRAQRPGRKSDHQLAIHRFQTV